MNYGNASSWFPVKRFTKSPCHFDWMMGVTKYSNVRDYLKPTRIISRMETVFWNRTLDANISVETYREARASKDPELLKKMEEIGLPLDIQV